MKRYAKCGYAAPFRFRVILEKPQGGAGKMPPPTRAKVKEKGWQNGELELCGSTRFRSTVKKVKQNYNCPRSSLCEYFDIVNAVAVLGESQCTIQNLTT